MIPHDSNIPILSLTHHEQLPDCYHHGTLIIGNFDGVHRGHAGVIQSAQSAPHPHIVLSFAPHPRKFFAPDKPHFILSKTQQRAQWLQELGIDALLMLQFDEDLAQMQADDFIEQILIERLHADTIISGDDFHFGRGRMGNCETLERYAAQGKIRYHKSHAILDETETRYSSTAIRDAITAGDMGKAQLLLGRPYQICGTVMRGEQIGRTLNMPTANMLLGDYLPLPYGVYAVAGRCEDEDDELYGVASFGVRPVLGNRPPLFESHFFDCESIFYDKMLTIDIWTMLRHEQNFPSLEALAQQMQDDKKQAQDFFAQMKPQRIERKAKG